MEGIPSMNGDRESEEKMVHVPVDGVLDLHQFRPSEVCDVLDAYIESCLEVGIADLRVIHGKGIGTLRETVHRFLKRDPRINSYQLAGESGGGWGATVVKLR